MIGEDEEENVVDEMVALEGEVGDLDDLADCAEAGFAGVEVVALGGLLKGGVLGVLLVGFVVVVFRCTRHNAITIIIS